MQNLPKKVWTDPLFFLAFGFGTGLLPYMPGTFGTLVGIPIYLLMASLSLKSYLLILGLLFLLGIFLCHKVSSQMSTHDHPGIVFDEIVGFLITMIHVPLQITWIILGFILFRIFDITKPWPIGYFDKKVQGGFGIMLDDLLAAIPAWLILQACLWIFAK